MRLPPKWIRRLLIDPALVLGVGLALVSLPLWVLAAAIISRYVPGRWRIVRVAGFLFMYLVVEAIALVVMFLAWIAAGFGWKLRSPSFQRFHYRLLGWILQAIVRWAKRAFTIEVIVDDPRPPPDPTETRRPALVMSRHAGPGDSILLMDALVNGYQRRPRIVLKEFLQWDPAVDVILNRLPAAFVSTRRKDTDALLAEISALAASMESDDAFVIFPEGANYTSARRTRAIHKLRTIGRPDLAERAEDLRQTLPPRLTGVKAALAAAPRDTDAVFIGHAGLEALVTPGDVWRAMPMDTKVAAKVWQVDAVAIPPPEDQEIWLYDMWADIDEWITATLPATAELVERE